MSKSKSVRVAMWSGPRNISTAMMRAWGNRADTVVIDEPFYACYLNATGKRHPMADAIVARGETDWRKVVDQLTGPVPGGKRIFFQKQMTHHLLPAIDRNWLAGVTNCFLIRDPAEVIDSYLKKNDEPSLEDIGFVQQGEIFDWVREQTSAVPPVLDARDVLADPRRTLGLLCERIGVEFSDAMLSWAPGLRETDGVWAKHWYTEVATSTGFRAPSAREPRPPPAQLRSIYETGRAIYDRLHRDRLH